jgi:hypothetical protein
VRTGPRISETFLHLLRKVVEDEILFDELFHTFSQIWVDREDLNYCHSQEDQNYRQIIGKGNFGIVYRASYTENDEVLDLCVKVS